MKKSIFGSLSQSRASCEAEKELVQMNAKDFFQDIVGGRIRLL